MGWFSGKDVTQVATSVSRVIADDLVPNSVRTGVLKSVLEQGNLSDYVLEEMIGSVAIRAERYYNYGKKSYLYGLPSGQRLSSTVGTEQVEKIIEDFEGKPVLMDYCHFGRSNSLHIGWMTLTNQYGYSHATNELATMSTAKGTPVYLKDMVVVIPSALIAERDPLELAQWGTPANAGYTPERLMNFGSFADFGRPTPINIDDSASEEYAKVFVVYQSPVNLAKPEEPRTIIEETLNISVNAYPNDIEYFHAKYTIDGISKYWMYKYGSGTYPTLDTLFDTKQEPNGSYYPFAYFRYEKTSELENPDSESYISNKKLVDKLGLDYDTIAEAINDNPDIKNVEQAMLVMGVPATTENPIEQKYLFDFFNKLYLDNEGAFGNDYYIPGSASAYFSITKKLVNEAANVMVIEDKRFKMALKNNGLYKKRVAGNIGAIGSHQSELTKTLVPIEVQDIVTGNISTEYFEMSLHVYRRQVTATLYEEVQVANLRLLYYIFKQHKTVGDKDDDILLIPIDRSITKDYTLLEREELLSRSLHYIFNSRVVTHLKWYQTGVFQAITIIIAVVITVYTYGADGGSGIAAALALSGTAGLIATIIFNLIIGQLLVVAFKLFAKVFGAEAAQILAVVLIAYGAYQGYQLGSLTKIPYAGELLMVANGLMSAGMGQQFSDLMDQYREFGNYVEQQTELLEQAKDLLNQQVMLSPFIIFGEKPEDFYNRTVHSGNIGVLGVDAVTYYCDMALTLPTINESLGGA